DLARDGQPVVDEHRHGTPHLGARAACGLGDSAGPAAELLVFALLVPELDHADTTAHRFVHDAGHRVAAAAQARVGDQIEAPVGAHGVASRSSTEAAISSGVSVYNASSHATENSPGPAETFPAEVPAAPTWACAATTASWSSIPVARAAPRAAAVSAPRAHPVPITFCSRGCPEVIQVAWVVPPELVTTTSCGPVTATTPAVRSASTSAGASASAVLSVESTPRPPSPAPASATVSDGLARIAAGSCSSHRVANPVRSVSPPTATGSSTHGVPFSLAEAMAVCMPSTCSEVGFPTLTSTPEAIAANSPASSGWSTIAGAAPAASNT